MATAQTQKKLQFLYFIVSFSTTNNSPRKFLKKPKKTFINMATAQTACVYASFILDGGDAASLQKVCKAAGIDVPASLAQAFGKLYASKKVEELTKNIAVGGGAAAAAAPAAAAPKGAAPAAGGKKKAPTPPPSDDDDDMIGGLF